MESLINLLAAAAGVIVGGIIITEYNIWRIKKLLKKSTNPLIKGILQE